MLQQVHLDRPANLGADIARQKVGKMESPRAATRTCRPPRRVQECLPQPRRPEQIWAGG